MDNEPERITGVLNRLATSAGSRWEKVAPLVSSELRRTAERLVRQFVLTGREPTVEAGELVNEFFLRLLKEDQRRWVDRKHFFAYASAAMRSILLDRYRARNAARRPPSKARVPLDAALAHSADSNGQVYRVAMQEAMEELGRLSERQARIVELRFFAGLELTEIAELLSVSEKTVRRDWLAARAFLYARLAKAEGSRA
jgi:RNA polymerase sigma-70 factor (ECF subfamily)